MNGATVVCLAVGFLVAPGLRADETVTVTGTAPRKHDWHSG